MGRPIKKGSTDQSTVIKIIDSTSGLPETAVEHDSPGIDLWWRREQETKTSITEAALAALDSAHSEGGIEHIGDGYYRLDLPDAAVAAGAGENSVQIGGTVTGMIVIGNEHALVDYDPYDTIRMGMTALPAAAANAAGGLPVSAAGGLALDTIGADTAAILVDTDTMEADLKTHMDTIETNLDGDIEDNDTLIDTAITDIAAVKADTAAILIDTDTMEADLTTEIDANETKIDTVDTVVDGIQTDLSNVTDGLGALKTVIEARATPAQVNEQVLDVMTVDTHAEPGQGNPPGAPTLKQMLQYPYKWWRNKRTGTNTQKSGFNDAGAVIDQKRTISDGGATYTETKIVSGP